MSNLNNICIILVRPQMGENIGATARVMKNFGISDLRIVEPRDGWPNDKATAMSAGAKDIIENVKIYNKLENATAELTDVYATTARKRGITKPVYFPSTISKKLKNIKTKTGIVFGQENNGLDNSDVSLTNGIITIPLNREYSSLNLAQTVGIICYELFQELGNLDNINLNENEIQEELANKKDISEITNFLIKKMDSTNFHGTEEKREKMILNLKNIFSRHTYSKKEISTLRGLFKN